MAQVLVRPESIAGKRFRIAGDEAHHLVRVLRAQVGDNVTLFDGQGGRFSARVTAIDKEIPAAEGDVLAPLPAAGGRFRFRLLQGLPKGSKFDYVIEKAVELGVAEIVSFLSEKSLIRMDDEAGEKKSGRWNRLAEAAAKQCERPDIPPIIGPLSFPELLETVRQSPTLTLSTASAAAPLASFLQNPNPAGLFDGDSVIINLVVGPESGLSTKEEAQLTDAGARSVSLGSRILRTETAGLAALAILDFQFNQLNG